MGDPFVALASVAEDLKKQNIPVVEYGEILNVRFGYPACIQVNDGISKELNIFYI